MKLYYIDDIEIGEAKPTWEKGLMKFQVKRWKIKMKVSRLIKTVTNETPKKFV